MDIAVTYLDKIGLGQQPYLIYEHHNAGHPCVHIATINVQVNGKCITKKNIGKDKSESTRREIEQRFNLVEAGVHEKIFYRPGQGI